MAEITKLPVHRVANPVHARDVASTSNVVRSVDDLKALYADAEARGDFGNARILSYRWSKTDRTLHCVARDGVTGMQFLYKVDPTSGKVACLGAVDH